MNTYEPNHDATRHDGASTDAHKMPADDQQNIQNSGQESGSVDFNTPPVSIRADACKDTLVPAPARPHMHEHARASIDEQGHEIDVDATKSETTENKETIADEIHIKENQPESFIVSEPQTAEWIELDETVQLLKQKGIERAVRTIQRYCQVGKLTCTLTPTEKGARYLVNRNSVFEFVDHHNSMLPDRGEQFNGAGFGNTSPKPFQNHSTQEPKSNTEDVSQTLAMKDQIIELKDQQLEQVLSQLAITNNQLEMKDDQIATMLERDKETHILLHNLQTMVGLPSGKEPDHRSSPPYDIDAQQSS